MKAEQLANAPSFGAHRIVMQLHTVSVQDDFASSDQICTVPLPIERNRTLVSPRDYFEQSGKVNVIQPDSQPSEEIATSNATGSFSNDTKVSPALHRWRHCKLPLNGIALKMKVRSPVNPCLELDEISNSFEYDEFQVLSASTKQKQASYRLLTRHKFG